MRIKTKLLQISIFLTFTSCSPYTPEPLTINHPGNPNALAGAVAPRSNTLAYIPADLASRPVTPTAATDSDAHDAHHAETAAAEKTAVGKGAVVAVVPATGQLVLQHDEIKDFMDAMTMGYPVEPASLLEGLKPGDKVQFAIDVKRKVIVKIDKIN
jgi:Cu/Ag efflux protein CusF